MHRFEAQLCTAVQWVDDPCRRVCEHKRAIRITSRTSEAGFFADEGVVRKPFAYGADDEVFTRLVRGCHEVNCLRRLASLALNAGGTAQASRLMSIPYHAASIPCHSFCDGEVVTKVVSRPLIRGHGAVAVSPFTRRACVQPARPDSVPRRVCACVCTL